MQIHPIFCLQVPVNPSKIHTYCNAIHKERYLEVPPNPDFSARHSTGKFLDRCLHIIADTSPFRRYLFQTSLTALLQIIGDSEIIFPPLFL